IGMKRDMEGITSVHNHNLIETFLGTQVTRFWEIVQQARFWEHNLGIIKQFITPKCDVMDTAASERTKCIDMFYHFGLVHAIFASLVLKNLAAEFIAQGASGGAFWACDFPMLHFSSEMCLPNQSDDSVGLSFFEQGSGCLFLDLVHVL
ncbi:hypothetical protein ACJX0J_020548, partial [Zea mays]